MDFRPELGSRRLPHDLKTRLPPATRQPPSKYKSGASSSTSSSVSNDRIGMLLMEANEISQYLKKDFIFRKADESLVDETVTFVKVINAKLNRSCLWPLSKLKEKLVKMRKLVYAEDFENQGTTIDNILFDGSDSWLPETYATMSELKTQNSVHAVSSSTTIGDEQPGVGDWISQSISLKTDKTCITSSKDSLSLSRTSSGEFGELDAETQFMYMPCSTNNFMSSDSGQIIGSRLPDDIHVSGGGTSTGRDDVRLYDVPQTKTVPRIKEPLKVDRPLRHSSGKSVRAVHVKSTTAVDASPPNKTCSASTQTDCSSWTSSSAAETQTADVVAVAANMSSRPSVTPTVNGEATCVDVQSMDDGRMTIVKACKDATAMLLARMSVGSTSNTGCHLVDRLLRLSEGLRQGIDVLLRICVSSQSSVNSDMTKNFKPEIVCVQLVMTVELMATSIDVWYSHLSSNHVAYGLLSDVHRSLVHLVKELTKDVEIFWQGCYSKLDVLVQESAVKIFALLSDLATELGKMSAALGIRPETLVDCRRTSLKYRLLQQAARADDLLAVEPGILAKHEFLIGCDIMVDKTLHDCQQAIDENERILQTSAEQCISDNINSVKQEVLRLVFAVLAKCKMLLVHLQQIQIALDSSMKDETEKPPNYYYCYFERCAAVISGAHKVVDSVKLLTRAIEPFHTEIFGDTLRKVCRCSEMVQRTVNRLSIKKCRSTASCSSKRTSFDLCTQRSSDDDGNSSLRSSSKNTSSTCSCSSLQPHDDCPILDSDQADTIQQAIETVNQSTAVLCDAVRQKLAQQDVVASASTSLAAAAVAADTGTPAEQHIKRMLPVVPGSSVDGSVVSVVRCHSARSPDRQLSLLSKHVSLIGFHCRRSNEI